jgi:Ankyrin repeats (3 copies)
MIAVIVLGCVAALVLAVVGATVRSARASARARRVKSLYAAAASGDADHLRRLLDGEEIDLRNREGNTALHLAYYEGAEEAVAKLIAFGADKHLRNQEGLTPPQMAEVAKIEGLLRQGAAYLSRGGGWLDEQRGHALYKRLRSARPRLYNPALVRVVLDHGDTRRMLHLAIKLGIEGSEEHLGVMLRGYGTREMATDFLNSGSPTLSRAAEKWAAAHNYRILRRGGRTTVTWGRF